MTRRIFSSIMLVAGVVLLAAAVIIIGVLYEYFGAVQKNELHDELGLAAVAVEADGEDYLEKLTAESFRLTWIAADGTVIYDTRRDAESLENHADREEIAEALASGYGDSTRYSATLLQKTIYAARRLSDGSVLRISVSRQTAAVLALGMLQPILAVLLAALILSGVLAGRVSRRIVEPLNTLDLDRPLENDVYEELTPLLKRINAQHREIEARMRELRRRTDEFMQVTGSMKEGLVLLDDHGTVLSINAAARELFGAGEDCIGADFLTVERSRDMSAAVEKAAESGHSEIRMPRGGREYQFDISRIQSGGETVGTVILAFDITEQEYAERNRREFTANVSHELKTPLQGIIGSAELIENGMVKPEDVPRFVGHIHTEAARLVTLIGDIIRLSQLDEGGEMPTERFDLLTEARAAVESLAPAAAARDITLGAEGESTEMNGVRRLVYEIIYNLTDNAIKYNKDGGSVRVTAERRDDCAVLTVADTGIGIAPEHQDRIFERFYRVDKSHSKVSGGTGLGLSIVKHAAAYHHARIELESAEGEGTTVRVIFPLQ